MSFDGEESRWMCGAGVVNLQRVSSMVREIGDPCLHHSPSKGSKKLKPEKWQTIFDSEGKVIGLRKVLKLIVLGGVDPSIRAEVWEFLLGCYALSSTAEHRKQLRMARRQRYEDLIRQCQMMHSSVGTGSLAYVVGSKVMDMRTLSRDNDIREAVTEHEQASCDTPIKLETYSDLNNGCTDTSYACERKSSSKSAELVGCRMSTDDAANDSYVLPSSEAYNCYPRNFDSDFHEPQYDTDSFFDFPPLPVTNLFQKGDGDENEGALNHVDGAKEMDCTMEIVNRLMIPDAPKEATVDRTTSVGLIANEDRVSEWLWTLHRIVVDVVRTDNHLEFYGDSKNMARMSDILAVYAWVDPATGYCQGMSDLLSPFVVLYEDNADAFWCFEMLLRRMMMWAADFNEAVTRQLEENCLDPLVLKLQNNSSAEMKAEQTDNGRRKLKSVQPQYRNGKACVPYGNGVRSTSSHPLCGLAKANFWSRHDQLQVHSTTASMKKGDEELPVFCVAAILITNRQKIMRETHSIDDIIRMFNDNMLKINVKRCIHMAIKLRKKYCYRLMKQTSIGSFQQQ